MNALQEVQADTGGRPAANDDFLVLQARAAVLGLPALLTDLGPCVVSGCRVYQTGAVWNVGPGMVWDGASLLPFAGRSNVSLPAMFAPGAVVVVDERAYQTGGTKTTIKEQGMDLVAVDPAAASPLVIDTFGALTFWHRSQEKTRAPSETQVIGTRGYVAGNYTAAGLGKPGTEAWGWALANGQHDTDDLRSRFIVGLDPSRDDYSQVGKKGGKEKVALTGPQNGPHIHGPTGDFAYNQLLRKAPLGSKTTASTTDGNGNGGSEPDITSSQPMASSGQGEEHENLPPYYVLVLRQWIGF